MSYLSKEDPQPTYRRGSVSEPTDFPKKIVSAPSENGKDTVSIDLTGIQELLAASQEKETANFQQIHAEANQRNAEKERRYRLKHDATHKVRRTPDVSEPTPGGLERNF